MFSSAEIRTAFLNYFQARGHEVVASSPLVPGNDPTLLFTNAGMVQFKETFLGQEPRSYARAVSVQRCVRAGGKHNDLENVGYTARHHTFFEMLGNFSFGDYFKRDAIRFAWEFLTEVCRLPPERLWVTVFRDDDEAAAIWLDELGVDRNRFSRCDEKDNFWSMGDTGPCGPCSEIFYDHGPDVAGGPPGSADADGDRYIEIWNLVFMQFDRADDGTMTPLPKPSVDTGMGLERLAAVLQGVHSNYQIDLFEALIAAAATATGSADRQQKSLRVIADHIRSCAFLITDSVLPSNEGRGYVLRRIIRRAIRHGHKLGCREPFFHTLVKPLVEQMGAAYPELVAAAPQVERVLQQEEARFAETLEQGMTLLEEAIAALDGDTLPGSTLFRLYDTYGFPADLTADIARERGLRVDMVAFDEAMAAQRQRARSASQFAGSRLITADRGGSTLFEGYQQLQFESVIDALYRDGEPVTQLALGEEGVVLLPATPFYAESGGQVGDCGRIELSSGCFEVRDTRKQGALVLHLGVVTRGQIAVGDSVTACVDPTLRADTARHHSATHLLHAALRQQLGAHVQQKGSLVAADRLRFDFTHFEPLTLSQIAAIEAEVNQQIRANLPVNTEVMAIDAARAKGAMALFGEKYGEQVRVLSMGDFSIELCGGTHVERTGDIGLCRIVMESGVASGVRRIEALCGSQALAWIDAGEQTLRQSAELLRGSRDTVLDKVRQLLERNRQLERDLAQAQARLASSQGADLMSQVIDVKGVKVLSARLDGVDPKGLRGSVDQLKQRLGSGVVVVATAAQDRVSLVAGVTRDLTDRIRAGDLVNHVAQQVGGKGGGRPDMAMAGGSDVTHLSAALDSVAAWVETILAG